MGYNKRSKERKWILWKNQEEKILRYYGMSEEKIKQLREYDWKDFNRDRVFKKRNLTNIIFPKYKNTVCIQLPINDFDDLLDQIDDEYLYKVLSHAHIQAKAILFLKIHGYTNRDISTILGLKEPVIRKRIRELRKKIKNF